MFLVIDNFNRLWKGPESISIGMIYEISLPPDIVEIREAYQYDFDSLDRETISLTTLVPSLPRSRNPAKSGHSTADCVFATSGRTEPNFVPGLRAGSVQ